MCIRLNANQGFYLCLYSMENFLLLRLVIHTSLPLSPSLQSLSVCREVSSDDQCFSSGPWMAMLTDLDMNGKCVAFNNDRMHCFCT